MSSFATQAVAGAIEQRLLRPPGVTSPSDQSRSPGQITLVEETLAAIDLDAVAADFYRRANETDPSLAAMFTTDPAVQRARFARELSEIVRTIRTLDQFEPAVRALGVRHRSYGVRVGHYRTMAAALLEALGAALGPAWTADAAEAWALAYNLTAETMLSGAMDHPPRC
jgi:hemoglobin-like flavoprotein